MLETIRDYAAERLTAAGEAEPIHAAHLRYYTTLAATAESHLREPDQLAWLARLEAEHDNCRAALRAALAQSAAAPALQLSSALWWFWRLRGYWDEGRAWLEAALARTTPTDCSAAHAEALCGAGDLARLQGDYATARRRLTAGAACREQGGAARGLIYTRTFLGEALRGQGDLAAAGEQTAAAVAVGRATGDPHSLALALNCLGLVQKERGDYAAAQRLFVESLALFQQSGDRWGQELALGNQGTLALQQGDYPAARALFVGGRAGLRPAARQQVRQRLGVAPVGRSGPAPSPGGPSRCLSAREPGPQPRTGARCADGGLPERLARLTAR